MFLRSRITWMVVAVAVVIAAIVWRARPSATRNALDGGNGHAAVTSTRSTVLSTPVVRIHDGPSKVVARPTFFSRSLPDTLQRQGLTTVAQAWALVQQLPDSPDRAEFFQSLLRFCLEIDPEATASVAVELGDSRLRDLGVTFVLQAWAERDAAAALAWAAANPRGDSDPTWLDAAFDGFAAKRPDEALAFLLRPELSADFDILARVVVYHFDEQGRLADARASIERLPESPVRDTLISQVVSLWARRAPNEAATWLASVASNATFHEGMATIVQTISAAEPPPAADPAKEIPDGRTAPDVLGDVVYLWAKRDLGGAAAWLRTQNPSPNLDAAIALLVEATAPIDPVEARSWLRTMSDSQRRTELARRLGIEP